MNLSELQSLEQYREPRQLLYPSTHSLAWQIRQNKAALVEAGAILCPTGRTLINPGAFDRVMTKIGKARAARVVPEMASGARVRG